MLLCEMGDVDEANGNCVGLAPKDHPPCENRIIKKKRRKNAASKDRDHRRELYVYLTYANQSAAFRRAL